MSSLNVSGTTTYSNTITCLSSFNVSGLSTLSNNLTVNGDLYLKNSTWHKSLDGVYRLYYGVNDI